MVKYKKLFTKNFLKNESLIKFKSASQIAKENSCSTGTVIFYMKKFFNKSLSPKEQYVGKKIGKIKINSFAFYRKRKAYWNCTCKCGNTFNTTLYEINQRCNQNKKCICNYNFGWTGYKEITGKYFHSVKQNAKNRNLKVNITIKYIWNLFLKQNRKCALSGIELKFQTNQFYKFSKQQTASLDRIDSSKGYIKGNLQWIHKDLNQIKSNLSDQKLIEWCNLISKYQSRKK